MFSGEGTLQDIGTITPLIPSIEEFALRLYRNGWAPSWIDYANQRVSVASVCPVVSEPHVLLVVGIDGEAIECSHWGCRFGHGQSQILLASRKPRPNGYATSWVRKLQETSLPAS